MQIYFHSRLCSYLSRVPILVEGTIDIDEFVSSSEQICINVALHHLLTNGSSAVNGCRQNESPNS